MARTPSMSPQDAEQVLGPRGSLFVTAENQPIARKWLTAMGLPGLYAGALARAAIAGIYNDTSDAELNRAKAKAQAAKEDSGDDTSVPTDSTSFGTTSNGHAPVNGDAGEAIAALRRLIGSTCDESTVRAIVDSKLENLPELVAKHASVTTIELKRHDGATHKVEGHTHPKLPILIKAMASRQLNGHHPNIMMVGPTGSGKTHAFHQACKALGIESRTNGAISMDHQLIGYRDANGVYHETPLAYAFGKACGYLFDEMDSSDNSPLLCLAGALANGEFEFPHGKIERHADSVICAAGNTWGHGATSDFVGRNKLDAAIRSRFPVRLHWEIDEALERNISGNVDWACRVQKARANAVRAGLKVIIDPRMSQAGAALIAEGMSFDMVAELTYLADLSPDQRRIVEA